MRRSGKASLLVSVALLALAPVRGHAQTIAPEVPGAQSSVLDEVIVTGTRETSKKARDSVSPIDVLSTTALAQTGQTNLSDQLSVMLPSVTKPNFGHAQGNATDFISLRGLNPSQTLVLVDGERRHPSSLIYIGGSFDGSTPVDLDLIPAGMIDHVEVLRDGAGAQYGSDAVAGVINIILKTNKEGGALSSELGGYYAGDGFTADVEGEKGFSLGDNGFVDLSFGYRKHDHSDRDAADNRTGRGDVHIFGDPATNRYSVGLNSGYNLNDDVQLYAFGTYAHRDTDIFELYRLPTSLPSIYPNGYSPIYNLNEDDFSETVGVKDKLLFGWSWNVSSTYGDDNIVRGVRDSANLGLFAATAATPTSFLLSKVNATQLHNNIDASKRFEPGPLPFAMNVSFGGEHRLETYTVRPGDTASYTSGGSQALAGLAPVNAGSHSRTVYSVYGDLESNITRQWQVGLSGRYENYSDFGGTWSGKLSTRYDLTPWFALRGTVSNGVRAPSLENEYYSAIAIGPTSVSGTLPANSAGATLLGGSKLKPEEATNGTVGFVLQPIKRMHITVDAYEIDIHNRIVSGSARSGAIAIQALALQGIQVSPSLAASAISASYFSNAGDTRTDGIDIQADYKTLLDGMGAIDWDAAINLNDNQVTKVNRDKNGASLINAQNLAYMTTNSPKVRATFGGRWSFDRWDVSLHELYYGETVDELSYLAGPLAFSTSQFIRFKSDSQFITNAEVGFKPLAQLRVAVGANNLFDAYPNQIPANARYYNTEKYDGDASQIGIDGGYYYVRASYTF